MFRPRGGNPIINAADSGIYFPTFLSGSPKCPVGLYGQVATGCAPKCAARCAAPIRQPVCSWVCQTKTANCFFLRVSFHVFFLAYSATACPQHESTAGRTRSSSSRSAQRRLGTCVEGTCHYPFWISEKKRGILSLSLFSARVPEH